jgi:hypothetical protein
MLSKDRRAWASLHQTDYPGRNCGRYIQVGSCGRLSFLTCTSPILDVSSILRQAKHGCPSRSRQRIFQPVVQRLMIQYRTINTIPTFGNVISVISSLVFETIADRTGRRKECCAIVCVIGISANIILSIGDISRAALLFAFFLSFVSAAAQLLIIIGSLFHFLMRSEPVYRQQADEIQAWGQEGTQKDAELRQMLVATGNIFTYNFMAWVPLLTFPTYDAPHFNYGYQLLIMFKALTIVGVYLYGWLDKSDRWVTWLGNIRASG